MTTTRRWFGIGLSVLLAGCGASSTPRDNAAAGATFAYGSPVAATPDQAGAMLSTVASIDDFRAAPGTGSGLGAADTAGVTGVLLQGGLVRLLLPVRGGSDLVGGLRRPGLRRRRHRQGDLQRLPHHRL